MVDGMDRVRGSDEATRIVRAANGRFVAGEEPVVTAARSVIRDHERDPLDGAIRTFGGRDESRLAAAVTRIGRDDRDPAEIEGRLKADVAIQRMGAKRERDISTGHRGASTFEARDVAAVHGDVTGIANEPSTFTSGAMAAGRLEGVHLDARKWIEDVVSFAGRDAASKADRTHAAGANMARIGGFASSSRPVLPAGVTTGSKGGPQGPSVVERAYGRDGGNQR